MTAAELQWVDAVIKNIQSGARTWSGEELAEAAKSFLPG